MFFIDGNLKEVAFVGCKFQAKFCNFVGLFDSTIHLRKSSHVAVRLFRNNVKMWYEHGTRGTGECGIPAKWACGPVVQVSKGC